VTERALPPTHAVDPDRLALELDTELSLGLSAREAAARLERDGPNELGGSRGPAYGRIAARQLVEPLVGLLVAAALVSAAIGETVEAAAIGLIVVLNCSTPMGSRSTSRSLTGESATVAKGAPAVAAGAPLAERTSMIFVATGARTEQGAIARLTNEAEPPPTPLQVRLGSLARSMVVLGVGVTVVLGAAMLARGESPRDAFLVGVSVAVAAVPEVWRRP
jgi:magnesium-transporting ATPase (P-type)